MANLSLEEARRQHQEAVLRQLRLHERYADQWVLGNDDRRLLHEAREAVRAAEKALQLAVEGDHDADIEMDQ